MKFRNLNRLYQYAAGRVCSIEQDINKIIAETHLTELYMGIIGSRNSLQAELVDKVVLVSDGRRSTRREVRDAVAVLDAVGDRVAGAVPVAAPRSWHRTRWTRSRRLPAAEDESGLRPPAAATG